MLAQQVLVRAGNTSAAAVARVCAPTNASAFVMRGDSTAAKYPISGTGLRLLLASPGFQTMLATEGVLRRDWDLPEEDHAWAHL